MLQLTLHIDALFEIFDQSSNKLKINMSVEKLHCDALIH